MIGGAGTTVSKAAIMAVIGAVFGGLAAAALIPALIAIWPNPILDYEYAVWLVPIATAPAFALLSRSPRHALAFGVLLLGASIAALPVSMWLLSVRVAGNALYDTWISPTNKTETTAGYLSGLVVYLSARFALPIGGLLLAVGALLLWKRPAGTDE